MLSSAYFFPRTIFQFFIFFDKVVLLFWKVFFLWFFCSAINKCKVFICCSPFQVITNLFYLDVASCICCLAAFFTITMSFQLYSFMMLCGFLIFIALFSWNGFAVMLWCIHLCKNINWFFAIAFFIFCCCNGEVSLYNLLL